MVRIVAQLAGKLQVRKLLSYAVYRFSDEHESLTRVKSKERGFNQKEAAA